MALVHVSDGSFITVEEERDERYGGHKILKTADCRWVNLKNGAYYLDSLRLGQLKYRRYSLVNFKIVGFRGQNDVVIAEGLTITNVTRS